MWQITFKINGLNNNILLFAHYSVGQAGLSEGILWLHVAWATVMHGAAQLSGLDGARSLTSQSLAPQCSFPHGSPGVLHGGLKVIRLLTRWLTPKSKKVEAPILLSLGMEVPELHFYHIISVKESHGCAHSRRREILHVCDDVVIKSKINKLKIFFKGRGEMDSLLDVRNRNAFVTFINLPRTLSRVIVAELAGAHHTSWSFRGARASMDYDTPHLFPYRGRLLSNYYCDMFMFQSPKCHLWELNIHM